MITSIKLNTRTSAPLVKVNSSIKSDCVNLVAPASPVDCLLYLPDVCAVQYKRGPERLTRLGNSNVLRLPVNSLSSRNFARNCENSNCSWNFTNMCPEHFQIYIIQICNKKYILKDDYQTTINWL